MCVRTYVILYIDPHIFVFASWSTPSHTSLNRFFSFSDPVSIPGNLLFTPLYWVVSECHKMHLGLKIVLLYSTLYSNFLELLVFLSCKMLWQMVTMVLKPFTRYN